MVNILSKKTTPTAATRTMCIVLVILTMLLSSSAWATDWYVNGDTGIDGPGSNCDAVGNTRGTSSAPFKNTWCSQHHAKAGDTVHLQPTIAPYPAISINMSGDDGNPVTFTGDNVAKITNNPTGTGASPRFSVYIYNSSNIVLKNFDISGDSSVSTTCVFVTLSNNFVISGNTIHGCGNVGIQTVKTDMFTISNNTVYGNAYNTNNGTFGSGISILGSSNPAVGILSTDTGQIISTDTGALLSTSPEMCTTGYRIVITGNIIYGNYNTPRTQSSCGGSLNSSCVCTGLACSSYGYDTDGNGIIIDRNDGSTTTHVTYGGRTLITNNVIFGNGGRGVHVYLSGNVDVFNNTSYNNNQDPYEAAPSHAGEYTFASAYGINRVFNNIAYSQNNYPTSYPSTPSTTNLASAIRCYNSSGTFSYGNNVDYNVTNTPAYDVITSGCNAATNAGGQVWGDPLFLTPSLIPGTANFKISGSSPAVAASLPAYSPLTDITGIVRGASPSSGAYQP